MSMLERIEKNTFSQDLAFLSMGDSLSKQGEKRSMSKNNIFMKKYERI